MNEQATTVTATPAFQRTFSLAENPLWDDRRGRLFWTDIDAGELWSATPNDDEPSQIYTGPKVGGFTLENDGKLLLFRENDIATFDPDTERTTTLRPFENTDAARFNDACALPDGTVLVGTIGHDDDSGRLYRVRRAGGTLDLAPLRGTNTKVSNGIAVTPDHAAIYWTDTTHHAIWKYAYKDHQLGERNVFQDTSTENAGHPDGLCVDADANVYSARWGGQRVAVYHPDATPRGAIETPDAQNVTSACFGGPDLKTLYITTAGGPLLACSPGPAGVAEHRSNLAANA